MTVKLVNRSSKPCDHPTVRSNVALMGDEMLAWSDIPEGDVLERASWRAACVRSAAVLAGCLMVAGLVVLGWRSFAPHPAQHVEKPPAAAPAAPSVESAPPLPPSDSVAQTLSPPLPPPEDHDATFLALVNRAGVHWLTNDQAIHDGHMVCKALDQGMTQQDVATRMQAVSPDVTSAQVHSAMGAAIYAYCPQHQN